MTLSRLPTRAQPGTDTASRLCVSLFATADPSSQRLTPRATALFFRTANANRRATAQAGAAT